MNLPRIAPFAALLAAVALIGFATNHTVIAAVLMLAMVTLPLAARVLTRASMRVVSKTLRDNDGDR